MRLGVAIICALFFTTAPLAVFAQTPPAAAPIAAGVLSGVVRSISGSPISDVSVSLVGESMATRSDSAGKFSLRDIPPGSHTALFRRIGYRSQEFQWLARLNAGTQITVSLALVPQQLNRVVIEAAGVHRKFGTSSVGGVVTDSADRAIAGADVRLLGTGLSTVTDSTGGFEFQTLAAGSYFVRARFRGKLATTHVVQIADDDSRFSQLKMFGLPRKSNARDTLSLGGYGVADLGFESFDRRARGSPPNPLLGPADMFRANHATLDFLLRSYRDVAGSTSKRVSANATSGAGSSDEGDCLLIDGNRAVYQPLSSYNSVSSVLVEVFRSNVFIDDYIVSQMQSIRECKGNMDHHPSYFVIWTRAMR